jgi:hypothetical protein
LVKLQMLLRPGARNEEGVRAVTKEVEHLGFTVTASGRVTVSAESSEETFTRVFGLKPTAEAFRTEELSMPAALRRYVENISLVPPHLRMTSEKKG